MNPTALNAASIKTTTSSGTLNVLRELVAAMPIVVFFKAARAALQR